LTFSQGFGNPIVSESKTVLFASYFQSDLKLRTNLLVKTGVRYDLNRVTFVPKNNGNFSPRLAVSYPPNRLKDLHLRAFYGLFFGVPASGLPLFAGLSASGYKLITLTLPFSIIPYSMPGHHFPESTELPTGIPILPQFTNVFQQDQHARNS